MPMPSLTDRAAAALMLAALAACAPAASGNAAAQSPAGPSIIVDGATVPVSLETAGIAPDGRHEVKPLRQIGSLSILTDGYASKPEGMSRCQAGQEVYFRVVDRAAKQERYAKLIESCAKDVVSGDPPFTWDGDNKVTINLVSEPAVTVTIGADGQVSHTP